MVMENKPSNIRYTSVDISTATEQMVQDAETGDVLSTKEVLLQILNTLEEIKKSLI